MRNFGKRTTGPRPLLLCKERLEDGTECGYRAHSVCGDRHYPVCYLHSFDPSSREWAEMTAARLLNWAKNKW
jgi:hypothetical protein